MKTRILIILCFLYGCAHSVDELKEKLHPVLTKIVLEDSIVVKLDSLIIDSVGSFTEYQLAHQKIKKFGELIRLNESFAEWSRKSIQSSEELAYIERESDKLENETMSLLLNDKVYNARKPEASLYTRMAIERERKQLHDYQDQIKKYKATIILIKKQIAENKLNATDLRGYIPYYRIRGADSKGYEVIDTLSIYLTKDFNLVPLD